MKRGVLSMGLRRLQPCCTCVCRFGGMIRLGHDMAASYDRIPAVWCLICPTLHAAAWIMLYCTPLQGQARK